MNNKKHHLRFLFVFLIIFGNITLPVFASIQDSNQISDYEHVEPSPPGKEWNISISFVGEPKLNRPVDLILKTRALGDLNYTNEYIYNPGNHGISEMLVWVNKETGRIESAFPKRGANVWKWNGFNWKKVS